jgi:magnesium-transporting ATPase (P-type)
MNQQEGFTEHVEQMNEAYFSFVDRIITLSTGALALSITFRTSFSRPQAAHIWILQLCWIAFLIAILSALAITLGRAIIHKRTANVYRSAKGPINKLLTPPKWFIFAGWIMSSSFAVAIVTLAIFAIFNIG